MRTAQYPYEFQRDTAMPMCQPRILWMMGLFVFAAGVRAEPPAAIDARKLFEKLKPSVVVISVGDRTGRSAGVGTGFFISKDGLIATNRHVIGESRDLQVSGADGRDLVVRSVHAVSKKYDLAIIQVEGNDFTPIELGMSAKVVEGEPIVAVGNPQGLRNSVVAGIVSAKRQIDGMPMLQLALPVEPGNSGGPVVDREGRVVGIVTMKSAVTENLGFAIESDRLGELISQPSPIPFERWRTIGALDRSKWEVVFRSDWRQRAGQIIVSDPGESFGGRTLCLSQAAAPAVPFELSVQVKLNDESGAAGLVFASDGGDQHYGFYPSGGGLRLTCFRGPDVSRWQILEQVSSAHYIAGEWNELKTRVEADRILCFVNGVKIIENWDTSFRQGRVGLVKFRDTIASFRKFTLGTTLPTGPTPQEIAQMDEAFSRSRPGSIDRFLIEHAEDASVRLERRARELESQAAQWRQLRHRLREEAILEELAREVNKQAAEVDSVRATLLIAKIENPELDVDAYEQEVHQMVDELKERVGAAEGEEKKGELDRFFFEVKGFHGSKFEYYHRSNSYLNEVIDDREGLPITLAVLYLALAEPLGLVMEGVGLPGHFVVRWKRGDADPTYIDVYDQGRVMTSTELKQIIETGSDDSAPLESFVVSKRGMVERILFNVLRASQEERNIGAMKRTLSALIAIDPARVRERWQRGVLALETGDRDQAESDARWLLEHQPAGVDIEAVHQMLDLATRPQTNEQGADK